MARYSEELMPAPNYRGKHLPNPSGVENLIPGIKYTQKKKQYESQSYATCSQV